MNARSTQNKQGFTIIEVVLVLAIAALIFLMVFIALPALQRSQRDTQRKNDIGRFVTALTNYTSNNRGQLPSAAEVSNAPINSVGSGGTFVSDYLTKGGDTFVDPDGNPYLFEVGHITQLNGNFDHVIYYDPGYVCDNSQEGSVTGGTPRQAAILYSLEGSGIYCQNLS